MNGPHLFSCMDHPSWIIDRVAASREWPRGCQSCDNFAAEPSFGAKTQIRGNRFNRMQGKAIAMVVIAASFSGFLRK